MFNHQVAIRVAAVCAAVSLIGHDSVSGQQQTFVDAIAFDYSATDGSIAPRIIDNSKSEALGVNSSGNPEKASSAEEPAKIVVVDESPESVGKPTRSETSKKNGRAPANAQKNTIAKPESAKKMIPKAEEKPQPVVQKKVPVVMAPVYSVPVQSYDAYYPVAEPQAPVCLSGG